jgi:hypothetical protein
MHCECAHAIFSITIVSSVATDESFALKLGPTSVTNEPPCASSPEPLPTDRY